MGTNFYRVRQITKEDKRRLHQLVDCDLILGYDDEFDTVESYINDLNEEVHICKRSAGWQMCFDHNNGVHYSPNRKSLEDFLNEPYTEIQDEYGNVMTPGEFWEMVDQWNADPKNQWISKTYREYCRNQNKEISPDYYDSSYNFYVNQRNRDFCLEQFGIQTYDNDFNVDGLTFAVFTDFS